MAAHSSSGSRRDRILGAAIDEFSTRGFAAARIDAIAAAAGCNKQLIYYYFTNKNGLYDAVFHHMTATARPSWARKFDGGFQDWVTELVRSSATDENYRWLRLLVMEGLDEATQDQTDVRDEVERREVWQHYVDKARDAQAAGEIDPSLDPEMVTMLFLMTALAPAVLPRMTGLFTDLAPADPEFVDRQVDTLTLLLKHLAPRPGPAAS